MLHDNGPRADQSMEILGKLKPAFDPYGTVTPGNSSQITDGAVALLVGTAARARELGVPPLGRLVDYAYTGCDPARMGLGRFPPSRRSRSAPVTRPPRQTSIEINEAFAAQVLAVLRLLREHGHELPPDRLNVNGGAIALGHPVGATGARLVLSSLHELRRRGAHRRSSPSASAAARAAPSGWRTTS